MSTGRVAGIAEEDTFVSDQRYIDKVHKWTKMPRLEYYLPCHKDNAHFHPHGNAAPMPPRRFVVAYDGDVPAMQEAELVRKSKVCVAAGTWVAMATSLPCGRSTASAAAARGGQLGSWLSMNRPISQYPMMVLVREKRRPRTTRASLPCPADPKSTPSSLYCESGLGWVARTRTARQLGHPG